MVVNRGAGIDRDAPILNIHIDEDGNKWIADTEGIQFAQTPDIASIVDVDPNKWSLLSVPDGNKELSFSKKDLEQVMGTDFSDISTAHLDEARQELWIGTSEGGVYQFKVQSGLQLVKHFTSKNSKLRSNTIQTIYVSPKGEVFVGTDDGLFVKQGKKEKSHGKYFDIQALAYQDGVIWAVIDGEVLEMDNKGEFYFLEVEERMVEGEVKDIAFDSQGRLWIASEIVIRLNDMETQDYDLFGPAQEFTSQFVNCISVDYDDALWVGTNDKGIYYIGKESSMSAKVVIADPLGCEADAKNAALKVRASGGQPPYDYKWTGGLKGANPQNVGAGTYTVVVTDQKGKSVEASAEIKDSRLTVRVIQQRSASLGGGADGEAEVKVSPESAQFSVLWDNGEKGRRASRLNVGEHSVTISGKDGCTTTAIVEITEALAPLAVSLEQTKSSNCAGENGGVLKAVVKGGQAPYSYKWNAANLEGEEVGDLPIGQFAVTITDATKATATAQFNIEEPTALSAQTEVLQSANTDQDDGEARVIVKGGTGKYTYQWDTGETGVKAKKLKGGTHQVTITDSNGCTLISNVEITEDILPLAVQLEERTNIKCAGDQTASLNASVRGGKAPYQYQWSTGVKGKEALNNLAVGNYQITVTDAVGNTANAEIAIAEPKSLTVKVEAKSSTDLNESNGKAKANASGGSGKYNYRWDSGATNSTAEGLSAGTHGVTVTDAVGCTATASVEIGEDILPLSVSLNADAPINCSGESTASISVELSGGKGPFQYTWNTDKGVGEKATDLPAGEYQVSVTDAAGNSANATVNINEPQALSASIEPKAAASTNNADGKAKVNVKGGSGKYTYQWDTGETGSTAEKLGAGQHTVSITDAAGCTTTASIEIGEDILPLSVKLNADAPINCAGESTASISVELSGGKGPFQYSWSTDKGVGEKAANLSAGEYQLSVTDAVGNSANAAISIKEPQILSASIEPKAPASTNNADGKAKVNVRGGTGKYSYQWDTGETSSTAEKLAAGTHTVSITDASGCATTATVEITENILPLGVELTLGKLIDCAGDNTAVLNVKVNDGKPPYQYQWNTDKGSGNQANNLTAGTYQVTVIDATGTSKSAEILINEPEALAASIQQDNPASTNNADGQASVKVQGGTKSYTYQWDNGETAAQAGKLAAGTHSVTITDKLSCTLVKSVEITENILPLQVNLEQTADIKCFGEQTAVLAVKVRGGKSPFQYQWNSNQLNGELASNLSAGNYIVTVTDASGLTQQAQFEVKQPEALTIKLSKNRPATNEDSKDGKASAQVTGGTVSVDNYSLAWDNGETGLNAEKLPVGAHSVSVTDANGCQASFNFETEKKIMPALTAGRLRAGSTLQVSRLFFEADSTNMTPESFPTLDEIAGFLEENPLVVIEVGGHTNNIPPHEFCDNLSTERAKSVATYIVQKGIDPTRVVYKGYGKRQPKYTNKTRDGRRKNQRVEIKILRLN